MRASGVGVGMGQEPETSVEIAAQLGWAAYCPTGREVHSTCSMETLMARKQGKRTRESQYF